MVVFRFFIFLFLTASLFSEEVIVESSIDQYLGVVNDPLRGTITITHETPIQVNTSSFQFENKPLTTYFVKEVSLGNGTGISIYEFTLPPKDEPGAYLLPPISVKIDGKEYVSPPSPYQVMPKLTRKTEPPQKPERQRRTPATPIQPLIFKLETGIEPPQPLYIGQRAKFFYQITYNRDIDLTFSELPLIHPDGFEKIGDVHILDYERNGATVQQIVQQVEVTKAGTYHFTLSRIEGEVYHINQLGQKVYENNKISAEAPAIDVIVKPFPINNMPPSFNGAIGRLKIDVKASSPPTLFIGEKIGLEISISGAKNMQELSLPNLECQPGFSGFFYIDSSLPKSKIEGKTKSFEIEIIPISLFIKAIPEIEVSSFDPETQSYLTTQSNPIPIKIEPGATAPSNISFIQPVDQSLPNVELIIEKSDVTISPLPPTNLNVSLNDLNQSWITSRSVFIIIPIGIFFIYLQLYLKKIVVKRRERALQLRSEDLLRQAFKLYRKTDQILQLIIKALKLRLSEKRDTVIDKEILNDIYGFITFLESIRFGNQKNWDLQDIKQKSKSLFQSLN